MIAALTFRSADCARSCVTADATLRLFALCEATATCWLCLRRCLENLISNANKYAGEAKVVLQKDAEGVVISVLDNGPGIPEEKLETVFEPYYRLESSRNSMTGGTGLGLCIARNMAALNGAELTLTNREEGGLCAQVRFLRR